MIFSLDSNMVKFAKILACQKFGNQPSRPLARQSANSQQQRKKKKMPHSGTNQDP